MEMDVTFPGGSAVDTTVKGFTIHTDQPAAAGGGGTGPSPFDLFLSSIGTCAGFYALRFCQEREIATEGLRVHLVFEQGPDPKQKRISKVSIEVTLPPGFPEKYRDAILRAVNGCTVKRHILEPPEFEVVAR